MHPHRLAMFVWALALGLAVPAFAADISQPNATEDVIVHLNLEKTDINLFLPANTPVIKAIVVNPADKNVGPGSAWSETLRGFSGAQMGIMIENVDKRSNRPNLLRKVLEASLKQFAEETHHPELLNAPLLFGGMSKGGGWSAGMGQDLGPRTIAFNNVCGWVGNPEKNLSMGAAIIIGGVPDGFKMLDAIPKDYEPARKKGAPWTLALQWGCGHSYGNANALAMPVLNAVMRLRLPPDADPTAGPVNLRDLKLEDGWLGDRSTWETNYATIASYADYKGDKEAASWIPNRYVAFAWRSFVSKDPPVQLAAQTEDGQSKLPPFAPTTKRILMIKPGTSVTLSSTLKPDIAVASLSYYDGDNLLATVKPDQPTFIWKNIPGGPRTVYIEYTLVDGKQGVSNPALIMLNHASPTLHDANASAPKP